MRSIRRRHTSSALSSFAVLAICLSALLPSQGWSAQTTHNCHSIEIATFPERIHVRCDSAATGGIIFFAVPTANNEHAARILSTLLAGHVAGRTMIVGYDPQDESGKSFGCAVNDCRRLLYIRVQ
jgi:hypothetical protein